MAKQDFRFHFPLRVRWADCDAQGIVFNSRYLEYLEVSLGEYYRNLGIRIYDEKVRAYFDTATVKTTIEFKAPGRADEMLGIYVRVRRIGNTSITLETEIYRDGTDELLTRIETVSVDFDASAGRARPVTDDVRTLVTHFEESGEVLPIERFPELLPGTGS